jgi:hypothetical protein
LATSGSRLSPRRRKSVEAGPADYYLARDPMATLTEQIIPRRKLLLIASETAIFTLLLFFGTSLGPLSSRDVTWSIEDPHGVSLPPRPRHLLTISVLCQASLSYNDLYDWKVSQNRRDLPFRLLHSAGYALVMFAILTIVLPSAVFHFPGLVDAEKETWKLVLLLLLGFFLVFSWRAAFHWFFFKWNFGERVLVVGADRSRWASPR